MIRRVLLPDDLRAVKSEFGFTDLTPLKKATGGRYGEIMYFRGNGPDGARFVKVSPCGLGWISMKDEYAMTERAWKADPLHVVRPVEWRETSEFQAFCSEWLDGQNLNDYLTSSARSTDRDGRIAEELYTAVDSLSKADIVHCDLRPENIILLSTRAVKIIDFQFAVASHTIRWPGYFKWHPEWVKALGTEFSFEKEHVWDDFHSLCRILELLTLSPVVSKVLACARRRVGEHRIEFPRWPRIRYAVLKELIGLIPFRRLRKRAKDSLFG